LKKSAEQQLLDAEVALGNLFLTGTSCCPQDINEAMEWYFRAASHAASDLEEDRRNRSLLLHAISGLGHIYAKGKGLPSRTAEAITLLSANTQGVPIPYYLGYISLLGGPWLVRDEGKAINWFLVMMGNDLRNSQELGSPSGQRLLLEYSDQEGKRLNFNNIIEFLAKASCDGVAEAQYALGLAHWCGWRELEQEKERAIHLFECASAQGEPRAQKLLLKLRS
jgi:TPR repeat protein